MKLFKQFIRQISHEPIFLTISVFAIIKNLIETYFFADWQFLGFLLVLVMIDTVLGFWKHAKMRTISSQGFARFFEKIGLYSAFVIATHVMITFKVNGQALTAFAWVDDVFYSAIIVREAISVVENIGIISPGIFPSWILRNLKNFDKTGRYSDLKNPNENGPS